MLVHGRSRVVLLSIGNVAHVNRLAADQEVHFAPKGLTITHGDNGSDKAGYARVLKRTCGSRCTGPPILPDVFGGGPDEQASATIRYEVSGREEVENWTDGKEVAPFLSEIGFFDLECATVEMSSDDKVLLTPPGLDLIQRFAAVCMRVRDRLRGDRPLKN